MAAEPSHEYQSENLGISGGFAMALGLEDYLLVCVAGCPNWQDRSTVPVQRLDCTNTLATRTCATTGNLVAP